MNTRQRRGFTLIELLVVISIMGILASIVMVNVNSARLTGRDAQRKSDLTNLKAVIELYRQKYGAYPDPGCSTGANVWVTEKTCSEYIKNLAPDFISQLPHDPNIRALHGYAYTVNAARTVFKIMATDTVEHEVVTPASVLTRCDTSGICSAYAANSSMPCSPDNSTFQKSYALWGGFADGADDNAVKTASAVTMCK